MDNKPPPKPKNADRRPRQYLMPEEVAQLIAAARSTGRYGYRDSLLIEICYRHGLRVSEIIALEWVQIDLGKRTMIVERLNPAAERTLSAEEIANLARLKGSFPDSKNVFCSERKGPLTRRTVHAIVSRAGQLASLPFTVHPQMLRQANKYNNYNYNNGSN